MWVNHHYFYYHDIKLYACTVVLNHVTNLFLHGYVLLTVEKLSQGVSPINATKIFTQYRSFIRSKIGEPRRDIM